MKILIYLTGGVHWLGGVQYTRNLLRAISLLPKMERPDIVLQISRKNYGQGFEEEFSKYSNVVIDGPCNRKFSFGYQLFSLVRRVWRRLVGLDIPLKMLLSDDCTVAFPAKVPNLPGPARKVYWVPDFQYKNFPTYFSVEECKTRDIMYEKIFSEPGILVVSSKAVQADFRRFFPKHHLKEVRVLSFTTTIDTDDYEPDPAETCSQFNLPDKFIYLPNQIWQHKGFDTAFLALGLLRRRGIKATLVRTGNYDDYRNDTYFQQMQKLIESNDLVDQIHLLGMLPRTTQLQLYRRAAFILQPSRFEGWSTSVEDARALGKQLLLSDITVHLEQNPENAIFFEVGNENDLATKIEVLWDRAKSGPSLTGERLAREAALVRNVAYAKTFLSIMKEASSMPPS